MNKLKISLTIWIIFGTCFKAIIAQSGGSGLIFDEAAYSKLPTLPYDFGTKSGELPLKASLKEWTPRVGNQGKINSCVGWATGYAALTITYAQLENWTDINKRTKEAFSALYIYNNIKKGGCQTGARLEDAGNFLSEKGDCKSADFDKRIQDCNTLGDKKIEQQAKNYRIKGYYSVFNTDDKERDKRYKVQKNIADGYPVVIGMVLRENFRTQKGSYWQPNIGNTKPIEGHAMVVVGYNENRQAFEVMNSWGTEWGDKGYIWIKYKDFEQYARVGYRYIIEENPSITPQNTMIDALSKKSIGYQGAFEFRYPTFNDDETYEFKTVIPIKSGGYTYKLSKKDWEVGDMYQLVVKETQVNRAIYVFSIDAEGTNIHWPRDVQLNEKFEYLGSGETPIIPFKDVEIVIPNEDRALTKRIEGEDNICIVYSYGEIADFKERVEKVNKAIGNIQSRFFAGFGDLVVPANDLNYLNNKMKFVGMTKSGRYVIPILLTLEGE